MVRLMPVLVNRSPTRPQAASGSANLLDLTPRRPPRLPSLYPAVSLKSLNSGKQGKLGDPAAPQCDVSGQDVTRDRATSEEETSAVPHAERTAAGSKIIGTPVVVGAASILRTATALGAGADATADAVDRVEDLIEEPECPTFIIVSNRLGKQYIYRFSKEKSLFLFGPLNALRRGVLIVITSQFFELFILLTIITNCIFLAIKNAPEEPEYVFAAIYTVEMILKIIGKGFFMHKFAYLRDPWNWLDFLVVILGYVTLDPRVANLSGIRTFRVLRALRTISSIEGLKTMVNALLKSMTMLSDVLVLTTFFICMFALVGMQLFVGKLRNKCVVPVPSGLNVTYRDYISDSKNWYWSQGNKSHMCGNSSTAGKCPSNFTCLADAGSNPNYGYTNFDNFGWAVVTAFQLVTMDFWEDVYNHVLAAMGSWYVFYFMFVIFFGSFYLLNLVLAVVAVSYQQEVLSLQDKDANYEGLKVVASSYSFQGGKVSPRLLSDSKANSETLASKCKLSLCLSCRKTKNAKKTSRVPAATRERESGQNDTAQAEPNGERTVQLVNHNDSPNVEHQSSRTTCESGPSPSSSLSRHSSQSSVASKPSSSSLHSESSTVVRFLEVASSVRKLSVISEGESSTAAENQVDGSGERNHGRTPDGSGSSLAINGSKPKDASRRPSQPNCWGKVQKLIARFTSDSFFDMAITGCIVLNTLFLTLEYHNMNASFKEALDIGNMVCTIVFLLEMLLKLMALGPRGYVKSRWNIFDGLIVLISLVDLGLELGQVGYGQGGGGGLSVLRTFRLMRIFKLAQSWSTMNMLLRTIGNSVGQLGNLTLVLGIIVYMLAVVGMQLFGNVYTLEKFGDDPIPRWNFDNFGNSFMMIFRVLCGEWIEPLYDCMRATNPLAILFFFTTLIIGNFMVLNLFLALLLNAFAHESLQDSNKKSKKPSKFHEGVSKLSRMLKLGRAVSRRSQVIPSISVEDGNDSATDATSVTTRTSEDSLNGSPALFSAVAAFQKKPKVNRETLRKLSMAIEVAKTDSNASSAVLHIAKSTRDLPAAATDQPDAEPRDEPLTDVDACCPAACCAQRCTCACVPCWKQSAFYRSWRVLRLKAKRLVEHKYFEWTILLVIMASSVTLVFEDITLDEKPQLKEVLDYLNVVFAVVFTLEFLLKLLGLGFFSFVKNAWNCLDAFIVAITIFTAVESVQHLNYPVSIGSVATNVTDSESNLASFRSVRTLRALRPLRAISRWDGMKVVVNSLLFAIPGIGNVLLVCLVFWLIFSIMGVQFFGGRFYKCVNALGDRLSVSVVANKRECAAKGYRWVNSKINFDNALNGFMALFQVATFEGWMEIMRDAVDARQEEEQPMEGHSFGAYIYFVVFIIVGSFFTLNLFIGVIIDNFNRLKKQYDDHGALDVFLTPSQRAWFNTLKKAANKKPKKMINRPKGKFQARLFDVIHSSQFEMLIMVLICLNMVVMMVQHYEQSNTVDLAMTIINVFFTAVFLLEAVVRLVALRLHYFKQPWNIFDFAIVLLSILGLVMDYLNYEFVVTPSLFRVARVFRIGRLLRFMKSARGIRRLLFALIISLPALFNIGALLFLVMFIYAIIGMSSFGYVKKAGALDDVVNFETFGNSMLLLFRLSTSAGWNDVLDPLLIEPPDCDPHYKNLPNGNCGTPWLAVVYFFTFILFTFLIIINMYIAIILENLRQAYQQEEVGITEDDLDMFYMHWERYDPGATQYILHSDLSAFVDGLEPPLRIPQPNKFACVHLNIPIKQGDLIHCFDVMQALVRKVIGADVEEDQDSVAFTLMKTRMEQHFISAFPKRAKTQTESTTLKRIQEVRAATIIQKAYRQYRLHAELKRFRLRKSRDHLAEEGRASTESLPRTSCQGLGQPNIVSSDVEYVVDA